MDLTTLAPLAEIIRARKHCFTLSVLGLKGGPGKTTVSTNLAWGFHLLGFDVLLVDSDHSDQITASLWSANSEADNKVSCIQISDHESLKKELPKLKQIYDVIIIDGRPNANKMAAATLRVSDVSIVPTWPSPPDIWRIKDTVDLIEQRQELDPNFKAGILLNNTRKNSNSDKRTRAALEENYKLSVFKSQLSILDAYQIDVGMGRGVLSRKDNDPAYFEMKKLFIELGELLND